MIRDYESKDAPEIIAIHKAQGFDYRLEDLENPLFLVKKVREVDGHVVGACFLRITAETFLFVQGSPEAKGRTVLELQPEILREAYEKGLSDLFCVLPPEIATDFAEIMERIGWAKDRPWPMFSRELDGAQCCKTSE